MESPRTWKWAIPLLLEPIFLLVAYWLIQAQWVVVQLLVCVPGMAMIVMLTIFIVQFLRYWDEWHTDLLAEQQRALSMTSQSVMLEAAKGVHPDTLLLIFKDRARRWGLVSGMKSLDVRPYSILDARPNVTDRFVAHFLKMSNGKTYMPKNLLSDGDKSFDPQKIVTAYDMYDAFESLLIEELKATRPLGKYKPGYWLNDWNPESVAKDFGLDLNDWDYEEEEEEPAKKPQFIRDSLDDLIPLNMDTSSAIKK